MSVLLCLLFDAAAQSDLGTVQQGEFGITAGMAHYFGDLNPRAKLNRPKPAVGVFYRKQFNNYLGLRISGHYAQLGYSDIYSNNAFQNTRNLSFNTDIFEVAVHGDFNFLKYIPGNPYYSFTPYVTIGVGAFSYNPYAYLNNKKVYLRPLGTEGQNIGYVGPDGKKRKPYGSVAVCVPIGIGFKYSINNDVNLSLQAAQRLTTTDYIDDVSTTYVGVDKFPTVNGQLSTAAILQDRSTEKVPVAIGTEGVQRGWSKQKDQYIIIEVGLSINISTYQCPTAK